MTGCAIYLTLQLEGQQCEADHIITVEMCEKMFRCDCKVYLPVT